MLFVTKLIELWSVQSCKNDAAGFTLCKNFTQTSDLLAAVVVSVLSKVSRAVENGTERGRGESKDQLSQVRCRDGKRESIYIHWNSVTIFYFAKFPHTKKFHDLWIDGSLSLNFLNQNNDYENAHNHCCIKNCPCSSKIWLFWVTFG